MVMLFKEFSTKRYFFFWGIFLKGVIGLCIAKVIFKLVLIGGNFKIIFFEIFLIRKL